MCAQSLRVAAVLFAVYCLQPFLAFCAAPEPEIQAITWMQVMSENPHALLAQHRFTPLRVVRWSVSSNHRIRIEDGNHVFITDCQTGESLAIDLQRKTAHRKREEPKPDLYRKLRHSPRERGAQFVTNGMILGREATMFRWPDRPELLFWCDHQTGEMLYGEDWHPVDDRHNGISTVSINFDHNARLSQQLFSLNPPPGFRLIE